MIKTYEVFSKKERDFVSLAYPETGCSIRMKNRIQE